MGYFGRLRARARNQDGWSSWKYTGNASAGADLVSESCWCVVYAADVNYQGDRESLSSLSMSTNFVNPLSSGNPCTVSCYMYTFDPTSNGSFDADAPPAGFYSAVSRSFEAGTVGSYETFSFGTTEIRPACVYFWFTSTVTYESYGSNSIYHYATGNYDSALNTGTKTPLLSGGFSGTDTGGSSGGGAGSYTAIASGSYSDIYTKWDFSYSRARLNASFTALTFKSGGSVSFSCQHSAGGDSFLQLRCYLSTGSGLDTASGVPTGTVAASASGGDSVSFSADVSCGQTYYLWTVIDYCGTDTVPLTVTVDPGSWYYSISDKGSHSSLDRAEKNFSMSMGVFQTGRMALSFAYSATVDISVTASSGAFSGVLYISRQPDIDGSTGIPLSYETSISTALPSAFQVLRGVNYYFFAVFNGGSDAGSISFKITAPPQLWYQGGSSAYSQLAENKSFSVSLPASRYHHLSVSFAHTGQARISCGSAAVEDGEIWLYFGENTGIDCSTGLALGWEDTFSGRTLDVTVNVMAGKTYNYIIRNGISTCSLSGTFSIYPPAARLPYEKLSESYRYLETSASEIQTLGSYSFSETALSFKYRGSAEIRAVKADGQAGKTVHLRAYLTSAQGIDTQSGVPSGDIAAEYTGEGESAVLTFWAQEERTYYLYLISSEIYFDTQAHIKVDITAPEPRYFSITDTKECYGLRSNYSCTSSPGESGIFRLEINFAGDCTAAINVAAAEGSNAGLCAYLSHTSYVDGRTGSPYELICEGAGTEIDLSIPVKKGGSYYLFVRCSGIYDMAGFTVSISCSQTCVHLYSQGGFLMAQPFVFHEGKWHTVTVLCRSADLWNSIG